MPHDTPPLVGRARLIADVVERAREGKGTVLIGPPGSGRSRILAGAADVLARSGARTARITVTPGIAAAPFGVYLALLGRPLIERIASMESPAPIVALRAAVAALGLQALIVDGSPTLDSSAAALMVDVAQSGVAVVVAAASEQETFGAAATLSARGLAETVELPPLSIDEVTALVEHLLAGQIDADLADSLLTASGGLPGPLIELTLHAADARAVVRTDGPWRRVQALPVPASLRSQVAERFAALAPDERGWIAAVAVSGSIADDLAPRIARRSATEAAERTGWTRRDPAGATRMRVPTDASAVVDSLDARARRSVLQRLLAAAVSAERELDDGERVAVAGWRLELGEQPDIAESLALAGIAGIEAPAREQLLRAAIAGGAHAHASLADHLRRTHRPDEAAALADAALAVADSTAERVELARVLAVTNGLVGRRSREALAALDARIAEHGPHPDLVAVRAGLLLFEGRPREALATAETVLGDTGFAGLFALAQAVVSLKELGSRDAGTAMAHRFAAAGHGSGPTFMDGPGLAEYLLPDSRLTVALELDDPEAALLAVHERSTARAIPATLPPCAYSLGRIRLLRGDPRGAVQRFREADAGSGSWRDSCLPRVVAGLAASLALAGELDAAAETEDRVRRLIIPPLHRGRVGLARAQLAASRGDRERAVEHAVAAGREAAPTGLSLEVFDAAYAALRYGGEGAAARLLQLGPVPAGVGREAQREHARAVLSGDPASITAAAERLWAAGLRLYAIEAGAAAADAGDPAAAAHLVVWAAKTPGLRIPGATDRRAGVLTSRERQVAVLAARGLPDRAIAVELGIALRTAQTHLTRAFGKLGVHRRTDLADLIGEV